MWEKQLVVLVGMHSLYRKLDGEDVMGRGGGWRFRRRVVIGCAVLLPSAFLDMKHGQTHLNLRALKHDHQALYNSHAFLWQEHEDL